MKRKRISVLLIEPVKGKRFRAKGLQSSGLDFLGRLDYRELLKCKWQQLRPDVVVVHEAGRRPNYLWLMPRLKNLFQRAKVIVVGEKPSEEAIMEVLLLGGDGYLPASTAERDLGRAIETCHRGQIWASRLVLSKFINYFIRRRNNNLAKMNTFGLMTRRESEILKLLAMGYTNKDIANALGIEVVTVKMHVSHLLKKFNLANRSELISYAVSHHLVMQKV